MKNCEGIIIIQFYCNTSVTTESLDIEYLKLDFKLCFFMIGVYYFLNLVTFI